jgi:hypothetical protein
MAKRLEEIRAAGRTRKRNRLLQSSLSADTLTNRNKIFSLALLQRP